mmetsp:Transcript_34031/g.67773  ORF Transcript_34031/g.67773 Transcript_34031/m.67773 type:complete len:284 (+) Transcript_34031:1318-2169(+)
MLRGTDGREQPLAHWMRMLMVNILRGEHGQGRRRRALTRELTPSRFIGGSAGIGVIAVGKPDSAARGLDACLKLNKRELHERLACGVDAIVAEVAACGDAETQERMPREPAILALTLHPHFPTLLEPHFLTPLAPNQSRSALSTCSTSVPVPRPCSFQTPPTLATAMRVALARTARLPTASAVSLRTLCTPRRRAKPSSQPPMSWHCACTALLRSRPSTHRFATSRGLRRTRSQRLSACSRRASRSFAPSIQRIVPLTFGEACVTSVPRILSRRVAAPSLPLS